MLQEAIPYKWEQNCKILKEEKKPQNIKKTITKLLLIQFGN